MRIILWQNYNVDTEVKLLEMASNTSNCCTSYTIDFTKLTERISSYSSKQEPAYRNEDN